VSLPTQVLISFTVYVLIMFLAIFLFGPRNNFSNYFITGDNVKMIESIKEIKAETHDLDMKLSRLAVFVSSGAFHGLPELDRGLIAQQQYHMKKYHTILKQRCSRMVAEKLNREFPVPANIQKQTQTPITTHEPDLELDPVPVPVGR